MEKQIKTKSKNALRLLLIFIIALFAFLVGYLLVSRAPQTASAETSTDLRFSLINNSTEYSVSAANKNLTYAKVPAYYNNLPVTHVANNGFMSCSKLEKVQLPHTMQVIGNNAFINCAELRSIDMGPAVSIGQNALSMCPKLETTIIPYTVRNMAASVFRNSATSDEAKIIVRGSEEQRLDWNKDWDSNYIGTIEYDAKTIQYEDTVIFNEETGEYDKLAKIIATNQFIYAPDEDLIIPEFYPDSNIPIVSVSEGAFMCSAFNTIIFDSGNQSVNFASDAFYLVDAQEIIMPRFATFEYHNELGGIDEDDIDTAVNLFTGSSIKSITLPSNINTIYASMFEGCVNLEEIKIRQLNEKLSVLNDESEQDAGLQVFLPRVSRIAQQAFVDCTSIKKLSVPNSVEKVGENIFTGWTNDQVVEFEHDSMPESWKIVNWNGGKEKYYFKKVTVTFDANNQDVLDYDVSRMVNRNSKLEDITDLPIPTCDGQVFVGWYIDSACTEEFNLYEQLTEDITLYAGWSIKKYSIKIDNKNCVEFDLKTAILPNGNMYEIPHGTELRFEVSVNAEYSQSADNLVVKMNGSIVDKVDGFYLVRIVESGTLTVDTLTLNQYTIQAFKNDYVEFSFDTVTVEHGESYEFTVFVNDAYNQSSPIIITNGELGKLQDNIYTISVIDKNITVEAGHLPLNQYTVTYHPGVDGIGQITKKHNHGENLQRDVYFTREGCILYGWSNGKNDIDGIIYGEYKVERDITIYAIWQTTITFDANGGVSISKMDAFMGHTIRLPYATRNGYWGVWNCGDFGDYYYLSTASPTITAIWYEKMLDSTDSEMGCFNRETYRYEIWTTNQFKALRKTDTYAKMYDLMIDIDLGNQPWTPLPAFSGTFYGNKHTISGINISGEGDGGQGLWSEISVYGWVLSLNVRGTINAKSRNDRGVGLLVGSNYGKITSCTSWGNGDTNESSSGGDSIEFDVIGINDNTCTGGLIGYSFYGLIEDCKNHANVSGNNYVDGIVGKNVGTKIEHCENHGHISRPE